ncbi:MAG: ABC-type Fe3+/spermidine/putrescine transport system ATPase subunit [Planctomycetota bacterium]|jgi:ABC-type Fe3+/spermidine/putrescine transport system ATPase subunit
MKAVRVDAPASQQAILGPIDLEISAGEHVLLVGPSGSGKTTLLRVAAGLQAPVAGDVWLAGTQCSESSRLITPPEKRSVGMLFQGGALWPHLSVAGNIDFVLKHGALARSARAGRIGELLELVDLSGFEKRMPGTLSGGEGQRLALARALAAEPKLLLLDEPLGPLDAPRREALLDRLQDLQRKLELTILHVTHDPEEARRIADRDIYLEKGRILPHASSSATS